MASIQTSITLDSETYRLWKESKLKLNHLVTLGLKSAMNNPGYIQRVNDLEGKMDRMSKRLQWAMDRLNAAEKAGFIITEEQHGNN